jgi:hypothetical protein
MYLYRITVVDGASWNKKTSTLYTIQRDERDARDYVGGNLKDQYAIKSICRLGYALGGVLFKGGKEPK